jgi:hypothetical protein
MGRSIDLGLVMRLMVGAALAMGLAMVPPETIPGLMAYLQWVTQPLLPAETIVSFGISSLTVQGSGDQVVEMAVRRSSGLVVGQTYLPAHEQSLAKVSTLKGAILQPAVLALPLLLAWPLGNKPWWPALGFRLLGWLVLLPLAVIAQVPAQLTASVWTLYLEVYAPDRWPLTVLWARWLDAGGRWALGLVMALGALALSRSLSRSP